MTYPTGALSYRGDSCWVASKIPDESLYPLERGKAVIKTSGGIRLILMGR